MVARLRNIMDSLTHRACSDVTIADEMAFLALEVEAYRAFVHRHGDALVSLAFDGDADGARAEADSLYFEVLQLSGPMESGGLQDAAVMARLSRLGGRLLALAQRSHFVSMQARSDRIAMLRDLVRDVRHRADQWPRDPGSQQSIAVGND